MIARTISLSLYPEVAAGVLTVHPSVLAAPPPTTIWSAVPSLPSERATFVAVDVPVPTLALVQLVGIPDTLPSQYGFADSHLTSEIDGKRFNGVVIGSSNDANLAAIG
jgi:hypothetical protein